MLVDILMTILYIILFIVCLSVLICIHELGHLTAAKMFNVYCFEYSIGFGPAIFKHKKKNGETYFSLRAIPFGGYVSMYDEGAELPEGVEIDPSRSLTKAKGWKKAIVYVAGVTMNAVLALILFFVAEVAFPQQTIFLRYASISENSIASTLGIENETLVYLQETNSENIFILDKNALITYDDNSTIDVAVCLDISKGFSSFDDTSWMDFLGVYALDSENNIDFETAYFAANSMKNISFKVTSCHIDEPTLENEIPSFVIDNTYPFTLNVIKSTSENKTYFEDLGISFLVSEHRNTFGESVKASFSYFGESSTLIVRTLGELFVSEEARENVGGLIAVGFETTNTLKNFGVSYFLLTWGMISVNLAIVNLLPFPGLDGWHLLVLIVEGISHKKIPEKVKNIVSFIGIAILMVLMVAILVKDFIAYIL